MCWVKEYGLRANGQASHKQLPIVPSAQRFGCLTKLKPTLPIERDGWYKRWRQVTALAGVLDYDNALMAEVGMLEILGMEYPHMQVLTVAEMLGRKRFAAPAVAGRQTLAPGLPGISPVEV